MVVLEIIVAVALGAAIGLEREFSAQPAGLRTHMLVSLGAALFTLAGTHVLNTDPTRIAAQVATGVGFLGGGAILREGVSVRGLTTAASLWVTAAVGVATGLGEWLAAVAGAGFTVGVLWLIKFAEVRWLPARKLLIAKVTLEPGAPLDEVERRALQALPRSRVLRVVFAERSQTLEMDAQTPENISLPQIAESLRRLEGVEGVEVSH